MDRELRVQILRAVVKDRTFLKHSWRDVNPADFLEREERVIAQAAVEFYEKYEEPIGSMLRSRAEELARVERFGADTKKKMLDLVTYLHSAKIEMVPVKALQDTVKDLKRQSFYENAVEEIIQAQEKGQLTSVVLAEMLEKANRQLNKNGVVAHDFLTGLQGRIERRARNENEKKFPLLLIDGIDSRIRAIGRGMVGLVMAPFASGKGMALVHIAVAYALQGLNVILITLEDPREEVENRLDSCMTGIPMKKLVRLPKTLRKRFKRARQQMRGNIRIIDGTEGGWTVGTVERIYEQEKQNGFTADAVIVDYDDELASEKVFKGDSARRFEFADIYRRMRQAAAKLDVIWWTAAQATRGAEGKKILTGRDVAEDVSKVRKVFLAIGIGSNPELGENVKHLYIMRHRLDDSRFGVDICTDYSRGIFYDRDLTLKTVGRKQRRRTP